MGDILIIKTGAAGDVIRTTSLLNVLDGNIFWVTDHRYMPLLPLNRMAGVISSNDNTYETLKDKKFDLVLSLEEDEACANLAMKMNTSELIGVTFDGNKMGYTSDSARWFDMSRISKLGMTKANQLKSANTASYQAIIFGMIGKTFHDEPYRVFRDHSVSPQKIMVGVERRTGPQWPNKSWWGYDELMKKLHSQAIPVRLLEQKDDIRDYLASIDECSHVVSGDTLAMHVAMAYGKKCVAIFNCTSPLEIHDYGLLKKMVSPLLGKYFYSTKFDAESVGSVPLIDVYNALGL